MLRYTCLSQSQADAFRNGSPDAHERMPERIISGGAGYPCRCCLKIIPEGAATLVFAHRPFSTLQPYAESGPVFLCANHCSVHNGGFPEVLNASPKYLVKGYNFDERIVYGTGQITPSSEIDAYADTLLNREDIAFVDVRSALNNCWLARITTA